MRTNGMIHTADEVYITDRNNESRELMPHVELVHPNWDIDRAGSKGQIQIIANNGMLRANMWIAAYRTITPERGEIVRLPRGHWRLERPSVEYDGSQSMDDGAVSHQQAARGSDIIDVLAGAGLTEPYYTPIGGNIMQDVYVAAKMATSGILGPNLLTNGGFESGTSGWALSGWHNGDPPTAATTGTGVAWVVPEGKSVLQTTFNSGAVAGHFRIPVADVSIPAGAQFIYVSGLARRHSDALRNRIWHSFRNEAGVVSVSGYSPDLSNIWLQQWGRIFEVYPVPPGAATIRIGIENYLTSTVGETRWCQWDDIRVGTATMMPLPDSRFRLPQSSATASTRIQTAPDGSYGYDAINADRLAAIGHYALATDMGGRLTTMPIRTLGSDEPKYTFGPDDTEILGDIVEVSPSGGPVYNHFRVIKEDFEDATNSMIAHAYNYNSDDPFSVINAGEVVSAPSEHVQDAVSQEALQAVADRARDRYSAQEHIHFTTMELPDLTVYDIVRIDDPSMPAASGLWAVESIDPGEEGMVIGARRALGGGS